MGCCQSSAGVSTENMTPEQREELRMKTIFDRFDKDKTGYISKANLEKILKDDPYISSTDVDHILNKFGDGNATDGKGLSYEQFKYWWTSTYTTYNDDGIKAILEDLQNTGGVAAGAATPTNNNNNTAATEEVNDNDEEKKKSNLVESRS